MQVWVGMWGVRHEIENDLKPPVGLVGDLKGRAAQVSLHADHDVEYRLGACLLARHLKVPLPEMVISLIDGASVPMQPDVHRLFRDGLDTQQGGLVMAGVVDVAKRFGRRAAGHGVIDQLQHRRQKFPRPRTRAGYDARGYSPIVAMPLFPLPRIGADQNPGSRYRGRRWSAPGLRPLD